MQFCLNVLDPKNPFSVELIVAQTVAGSLYGIAIQLVLIPPIVLAMQRARLISKY